MDSASSSKSSRKLEFCDNGHTFYFPPDQLPKHKIFISHSGKQKNFAEQLCEDLERWGYYPFFDKRDNSLPRGENFPNLIFKATRECFLAILLLSEEFFTRSKWPMLELASFVQAQKTRKHLRILPVLLDLCIGDLKDTARWSELWENWAKQDIRLDIYEWKTAVQSLRPVNMLRQSSDDGEVALRKEIVRVVLSMMPPDIQADVAHVQGQEHLYQEIVSKFSNIPTSSSKLCENAKVLGVYGIVGTGKSTLCMILTHFLRREFQGRVCHVEFNERDSTLKLQCKALKQLTGADQDYLNLHITTKEEGLACLKERIPRQQVFLALDNVSDIAESVESARMFLKPKFHQDSLVLVTSRSRDVLQKLGIPESCCMLCPHVTAKDALNIVLDHINISSIEALTEEQTNCLDKTLDLCKFEGLFHPMSLKVLASQMGSSPSSWNLGDLDLQEASDKDDPLFSAIETNFLRLPDQQSRDIFMDIALFCPESVNNVHDVCMWLSDTLHSNCDINRIKRKLHNLRLKSLLEVWSMDADIVRIHDLHRELAKRKARVEDGNRPRFVYQRGDKVSSAVLSTRQLAKHIERAAFAECSFTTLSFEECSCLQLLCLRSCEKLATLSLHGVLSLVSMELSSCPLERLELQGLVNLRWLCVHDCGELMKLDASGLKNLTRVWVSRCIDLTELTSANSNMLKSLSVSYNSSLVHVDVGSGQSLQCLTLWFCEVLTYVHLSGPVYLSEFKKRGCPRLLNIQGCNNVSDDVKCLLLTRWHNISSGFITSLEKSTCLQVLDLWDCPVSRLPDLRGCSNLHELRLSDLDVLLDSDDNSLLKEYDAILVASSESLGLPVALQDLRIASCRNVVVKEVCWKLQGLKNLVVLSMQRVRVAWDWELYMPTEQKGCDKISRDSQLESSNEVPHTDIDINREAVYVDLSSEGDSSNEGLHQGAPMVDSEIFNCLCQIMYWVQEYLERTANNSHLERELKRIVELYRGKNTLMAVSEDIGPWMTSSPDRIRKLQYGIIERTLLETCNSCDTACEQVFQRLSEGEMYQRFIQPSLPSDKVEMYQRLSVEDKLVDMFRSIAAQELKEQLEVLRVISPQGIVMLDDLETWEEEIINELATYEKVRSFGKTEDSMMWENTLMGEGIILRLPRVETLKQRLDTLTKCRAWTFTVETVKECRWDWLRSCKICILIEQLLFFVERQAKGVVDEGGGSSSNFQWLGEMVEEIDNLLQIELDKTWSEVDVESFEGRGILRGWKTRQWLQALASCLSQDLVQEKRVVTDKGLQSINQEIIKARYAKLLYPDSNLVARALGTFKEGIKDTFAIAEALALKMQEKQLTCKRWEEMKHTWENVERKAVDLQEKSLSLDILISKLDKADKQMKDGESYLGKVVDLQEKLLFLELLNSKLDLGRETVKDSVILEWRTFLRDLLDLSNLTKKGRVDMPTNFMDCIEMLLITMNIVEHGKMSLKMEAILEKNRIWKRKAVRSEIPRKIKKWKAVFNESRTKNVEVILEEEVNFEELKRSESLAKMLREELLELWNATSSSSEMWDFTFELASKLADSLEWRKMADREMKDLWEWAGGMPFQQRLNYIMNIEKKMMQLCPSAAPEIRQHLLSMINKQGQDTFVAPEESECFKLIQHFQFMEQLHWEYKFRSSDDESTDEASDDESTDEAADEAALVKMRALMMEGVGKMRALMMSYEFSSEQQTKIWKEDGLQIWRRAEKFPLPLRKIWNNINRDQKFVLPITNCSRLCHLHISTCKLRIPPYAQERSCIHKKLKQQHNTK